MAKIRVISEMEIRDLASMRDIIDVLEEGFKELTLGSIIHPERTRVQIKSRARFIVSSAYVGGGFDAFATKVVGVNYENPTKRSIPSIIGVVVLNDPNTGEMLAVINGTILTAIRTAACAALAAKYMARKDSESVGIFGTGAVGKELIKAFSAIREIKKVKVLGTSPHKCNMVCKEASEELGISVVPANSPKELVKDSDIIGTATSSAYPVFDGEWLEEGTHISSVEPFRAIDDTAIRRVKKPIVVDLKDHIIHQSQDIVAPILKGLISESDLINLGKIVLGEKLGRTNDDEITLFKTCGMAMEDAVTAHKIYNLAKSKNLGTIVTL